MTHWLIHVFNSLFNKCLLDTFPVPSTDLTTGDTIVRSRDTIPAPKGLHSRGTDKYLTLISKVYTF